MTSTPTVVAWDLSNDTLNSQADNIDEETGDEDDVWGDMQTVDDEGEDGDEMDQPKKRKSRR